MFVEGGLGRPVCVCDYSSMCWGGGAGLVCVEGGGGRPVCVCDYSSVCVGGGGGAGLVCVWRVEGVDLSVYVTTVVGGGGGGFISACDACICLSMQVSLDAFKHSCLIY